MNNFIKSEWLNLEKNNPIPKRVREVKILDFNELEKKNQKP